MYSVIRKQINVMGHLNSIYVVAKNVSNLGEKKKKEKKLKLVFGTLASAL